jgi:chromosomal replication initiator protein
MVAEIEKPTQNLRFDILAAKVELEGLHIPNNVLKYISENIDESVRDLEGIINSLMAYSVVYNCNINMGLVQKVMPRFVEKEDRPITIEDVKQSVCDHFGLEVSQLDSRSRTQKVSYARQISMYVASILTEKSMVQIGLNIGKRNHATVIHAIKIIKDSIAVDEQLRQDVEEIENTLRKTRM